MRCGTWMLALGCGLLGFGFGPADRAAAAAAPTTAVAPKTDDAANPAAEALEAPAVPVVPSNGYIVITNRNAFGIKPPPEPPPPQPVVPATPPPNLFLTGLSFLHGAKRAYLVVNKTGAKQPEYLSVEENYDSDGLKVLEIDPRKQIVRVSNAGTEVTLNFKDNGLKPNAVPVNPGVPGGMPPRGVPPPPGYTPAPAAQPTAAAPTVIGRGGSAADTAAATPTAVPATLDAAATETPAPRQLPTRRGVFLGGTATGVTAGTQDSGTAPTGPVAPSHPGTVTGQLRPGTVVPPIPGQ